MNRDAQNTSARLAKLANENTTHIVNMFLQNVNAKLEQRRN